jgi:integrase
VRCTRSPTQRVESILGDRFPLKKLVRLVRDLEADEPPQSHERDYAAWIRDVLLCKMLISNPLRVGQFSIMRFRGNRPNLYQTNDGGWRLRFDPTDFKNQKGAACMEYDTAVEPTAWPWIRRYLSEARPKLLGAETDYLLLPGVEGPKRGAGYAALDIDPAGNWLADSLATRVKVVTARYMPDGNGFGPHAFRHIIATDHLKRHPEDYVTVAQLLHDKLATVMRAYAHLKVDDGLRTLHEGVAQAMREIDEARG